MARTVEVTGSVKTWSFVNPHPILVLEVTDERTALGFHRLHRQPRILTAALTAACIVAVVVAGEQNRVPTMTSAGVTWSTPLSPMRG